MVDATTLKHVYAESIVTSIFVQDALSVNKEGGGGGGGNEM